MSQGEQRRALLAERATEAAGTISFVFQTPHLAMASAGEGWVVHVRRRPPCAVCARGFASDFKADLEADDRCGRMFSGLRDGGAGRRTGRRG